MKKIEFAISLLFFWVKGAVEVDNRFVKTRISNTILGVIPAGKDQQSIPLKNISGSMLSTKFFIKPFAIGFILILVGFGSMGENFIAGFILLLIGAVIAAGGIQTLLVIEKAGSPYQIYVPFFEKQKMHSLNNIIHEALSDDTDKTDLNMFFDKKVQ